MATALEQGIEAMQSGQVSILGERIDPSETTIVIQVAQSQLATLVSRIHSPSRHIESSLRLNAITNCFGRIHDSITKLESIALASSGYDTTPSSPTSSRSPDVLEQFLISTGHSAKHWKGCVWDECETHMEGKHCHYYPSGPHHIPASRPLNSASCFITPHHPKRRFEDIWAIPSTLTSEDEHPVLHTIINRTEEPVSNHIAPDEDCPVTDAPLDHDDPFPDQPARALNVRAFQLSQYLKGKWFNALCKATARDSLFDIVKKNPNHPSWIIIDGLLHKRGEDDSQDCPYVPYEAAHEGDNIRSKILLITNEQMAHMGAQKCVKYTSRHFS